jgi:hypothetical protein
MRHLLFAAALASVSLMAGATEVGLSINIGQPGFYGPIDIGGYPPPPVIYRQPRIGYHVPADRPPLYLHVPPSHARNWSRHCGAYNACNERVYFVKDKWYRNEYAPRYRERSEHRDDRRGNDRNNQGGNHGNNR